MRLVDVVVHSQLIVCCQERSLVIRCKDKTYLFFGPGVILRRSYRTGGFIPKSDIDRGIKTWVLLKYRLTIVTTNVVTSNPAHGKVYSIQHYVIKFVRDLW